MSPRLIKWILPWLVLATAASAQMMMRGYGSSGGATAGGCAMLNLASGCPSQQLIGVL